MLLLKGCLGLLVIAPPFLEAQVPSLEVRVCTNKQVYAIGEPVEVTVQACNTSSEPYTVEVFDNGCPLHQLNILDEHGGQVANLHSSCGWCPPGGVPIELRWEPGECSTGDTVIWNQRPDLGDACDQSGPPVPPGIYVADATGWLWEPATAHDSEAFSIVQSAVPVSFQALMLLVLSVAATGWWILHRARRARAAVS
jgi:hypothetical protein